MRTNTVTSRGLRQILPSIVALAVIAAGLTVVSAPQAAAIVPASLVAWGDDSVSQGRAPQNAQPAAAIAAGGWHVVSLRTDGTVVAWGRNYAGQASVPSGLSGVTSIAAGWAFTLALKSDGSVAAWGENDYGQVSVPPGLAGATALAAGFGHGLAIKSDKTVVAWGDNGKGQTTVPSGLSGVTAIAAGGEFSLALKTDGTVVAWGTAEFGQTSVPAGLTNVVSISAGRYHALATKSDGTVVAWGRNTSGESTVPAGLSDVKAVAAGDSLSIALKTDGSVVQWGSGHFSSQVLPPGLTGVTSIAAGGNSAMALQGDGSIRVWGDISFVSTAVSSPIAVAAGCYSSMVLQSDGTVLKWGGVGLTVADTGVPPGLSGVIAIDAGGLQNEEPISPTEHYLALKSDGTVVAFGDEAYQGIPMPTGLSGVVAISAGGEHSLALKSDGTVVAWGANDYQQSSVPVGLAGVVAISAGAYHSLALKSDGTVVAWGSNFDGALDIPAGLSGVTAISAGGGHNLALKADGTIVAWGNNQDGQSVVPSGLTGVAKISAGMWDSLAVKNDGTVVGWGWNGDGEATAPVGLSGVTSISAGCRHTLALGVVTPRRPGAVVSVSPSRLLDTRITGPKVGSAQTRSLKVTGVGGVPATGVSAVVLNVTVTDTTSGGYLTVSPTGTTRPVVSNLNWSAGATIPNAVTVKVGTDGKVDLFQSGPGSANVIVDVAGYYMDGSVTEPGGFSSLAPDRILDTRSAGGKLVSAETRDLQILGAGGVPESNVSAVVLNVTVTDTNAVGYLTVFPSGVSKPLASNLNWSAGWTIPNLVTVKVGDNGKVSLFQSGPGSANVIVDVAGYYLGGTPTQSGMFVAISPARVLDTRSSSPLPGLSALPLTILNKGGVPATGVAAVVLNTTVTDTVSAGYLTVYPGTNPLPTASNLNWSGPNTTIPNLVTTQVGLDGTIKLYNGSFGSAAVIADTAGYFLS